MLLKDFLVEVLLEDLIVEGTCTVLPENLLVDGEVLLKEFLVEVLSEDLLVVGRVLPELLVKGRVCCWKTSLRKVECC